MSRYFHISAGLRGCYMPDTAYVVRVDTRRELKAVIANEMRNQADNCDFRYNKRDIAHAAKRAWDKRRPLALPIAVPYGRRNERPFGVFVSRSDRDDWKADQSATNY
jgi:hypothetical protein